jgi:CubicO group peptidase (beta-lactamase class C family)
MLLQLRPGDHIRWKLGVVAALGALHLLGSVTLAGQAKGAASTLEGVWEASRHFGPDVRGTLDIVRSNDNWRAQIAQFDVPITFHNGLLSLELPSGQGWFEGRVEENGSLIRGDWVQPATVNVGKNASPVILRLDGKDRWRGEVVPLEDEFTLYLVLTCRADGSLGAVIRNPDRNIGVTWRVERLAQNGIRISLISKTNGPELSKTSGQLTQEKVIGEGIYDADNNRMSIYFPDLKSSYDFSPIGDNPASNFYARGKEPVAYRYKPPSADDDGWAVGTLSEVGMSAEPIGELVRKIETPFSSLDDPYVHGFLVARHGKLVAEEYFYGFHRLRPHGTRSASKSLTSILLGAAIRQGAKVDPSTPVYDLLYNGAPPKEMDPRKREMKVEHLLNMSSGYDCDDRVSPPRPGNEDAMLDGDDPDYYRHTLNLPMEGRPGQRTAYCSINPNLLGAVLHAATQRTLKDLFQDLIADPLRIRRYYLNLQPTGEPYMGGGINWLPRDFMKLGQLMLDRGTWNGKRILSKEWVQRSSSPMVKIRSLSSKNCEAGSSPTLCLRNYGYLWWHIDFPYRGRRVHAFYAGGNGGQVVAVIPELDMVVAIYAGNYASLSGFKVQEDLIPQYILPALVDASR